MTLPSDSVTTQPSLTFWGAAQSVTGSMHLFEAGGRRLLLDCGLMLGHRHEARQRNSHFPFDPAALDAVVISHAHVDHCGNLPNLVRQGFRGPIYCTPATRDLLAVLLADTARIQEEEAHVARTLGPRANPANPPLFTGEEVRRTVLQCVAVPYGQPREVFPFLQLLFADAGHILGSAMTSLTLEQGGRTVRVTFTGDLGRCGLPFLREPAPVPPADLLVSESTYGGRVHDSIATMAGKMSDVVRRTAARGGKVLIPAFSLGRTQVVLHYLRRWMADGTLPALPVYVDSPLAAEFARVYQKYPEFVEPVAGPDVEYLDTPERSLAVSTGPDPCVIVASGGMCDGGKILRHLRHHIDDPRSTLVLVSYQAPHSLGARLLEYRPTVRFHGKTWNKWLEVVELSGFSGHADHNDFETLLGPLAGQTREVCLVHGEPQQAEALATTLRQRGFSQVTLPRRGQAVDLL